MENGNVMVNEYHTEDPIILESFMFNKNIDIGARNDTFSQNLDSILDFSESNPFGKL